MKVEKTMPTILAVSDSIGETAEMVTKAALIQFKSSDVTVKKIPYVIDKQYALEVIEQAEDMGNCVIVCTIVLPEVREFLLEQAKAYDIPIVDIMGPTMKAISEIVEQNPELEPGLVHKTDADYFKKMEAIEFAVRYDDGKDPRGLYRADVVLIGVSRTSKTPLALYLAHQRLKVANLPLVPEVVPPKELFKLPKNRVVGLTITPEKLYEIRCERLKSLGLGFNATYTNRDRIIKEIDYAEKVMDNLSCPKIDVSNKAVEEIATNILGILKKGD